MNNSKTNQTKPGDQERDPLKEALEKAAAIDELHKGPASKIPVETKNSEEVPGEAENADDSGE